MMLVASLLILLIVGLVTFVYTVYTIYSDSANSGAKVVTVHKTFLIIQLVMNLIQIATCGAVMYKV